jgi:hypothetical protein
MREAIAQHLATIPEGKRGALLVIADDKGARAHLAARLGDNWKVAFEAGRPWVGKKPEGAVMLEGSW